ncbi:polyprenyl diphosphate synthase [Candidatus Pelagibacter sp.]|nr:polyprenyl diphosphate synthase [Candidatus Pelagibacter sp.]
MNPIKHMAIIMDGNGRWGLKHKNSRNLGHKEGLKTVEMVMKFCINRHIKFLTLYAFSTENWKRPLKERNYLFNLLEIYLKEKLEKINNEKIKIKILGEKKFSLKLNNLLDFAEKKTVKNTKLQINLALNYGSKKEIVYAFNKLKKKSRISENDINNSLYTKNIPDPEILIRTGNTQRLSNFLLWQAAYTEIFFEKKLWPDFKNEDLKKILRKFNNIKRNFGKI